MLGFFGFFDLGLSRATANQVAKMNSDRPADCQKLVWTALALNVGFGVLGAIVLYLVVPPLILHVFKMAPSLRQDVLGALPWICSALPHYDVHSSAGGNSRGIEQFAVVNTLQVGSTLLFQIVPLGFAYFVSPDLIILIPAAVLSRAAIVPFMLRAIKKHLPLDKKPEIDGARFGYYSVTADGLPARTSSFPYWKAAIAL